MLCPAASSTWFGLLTRRAGSSKLGRTWSVLLSWLGSLCDGLTMVGSNAPATARPHFWQCGLAKLPSQNSLTASGGPWGPSILSCRSEHGQSTLFVHGEPRCIGLEQERSRDLAVAAVVQPFQPDGLRFQTKVSNTTRHGIEACSLGSFPLTSPIPLFVKRSGSLHYRRIVIVM